MQTIPLRVIRDRFIKTQSFISNLQKTYFPQLLVVITDNKGIIEPTEDNSAIALITIQISNIFNCVFLYLINMTIKFLVIL